MWVNIILLCLATSAYARPEIIRPDEDAVVELQALAQSDPQELQDFIEAEAQPDELNRKKKQITTFCVEIRPSDHKPFQVCEPYRQKDYYPNQHEHQHHHEGGGNHIKSQSDHSGGGSHVKPAFSTPIKTYVSSESSRPPPKQSFEGFQSNFPEVHNLGPARAASEDEMQIENEIPSHGAANANKEGLKFFDIPVPVRSAFEDENDRTEDENPSKSSPTRSAFNTNPVPAELKKEDTPVDDTIHEEVNEAPRDIGKAVKPSDENLREAVNDDIQEDINSEVKSNIEDIKEEVKSDIKDVKEEVKSDIKDVKEEVKSDIKDVKEEVKLDIKDVKEHVKSDIKEDDKGDDKEKDPTHVRAAEPTDAYKPKPGYGHQMQYIPYSPIHQNHHSGLVITCQPNLAGYAHKIPDPYSHQEGYHSGGHSSFNHRAADPTFGRPYHRPQAQYGNYGGYKPYQPYRPQAQHYQGPAYPHPQPYHKAPYHKMDPYKQEQHYKPDPHYKPPHQSYQYYPYAPAYPQQPQYKPSQGFGHKPENIGEHHLRSSDVLERVNEKDEQNSFDEETKEQHTLEKMEDISKQRLADSWIPDGMEEVVFVGQAKEASPVSEHDHLSNVDAKSPLEEEKFLSHNIDGIEAGDGGQSSANPNTPANAKEAEDEENQRIASFGKPESENVHSDDQGAVKEAEKDGLRSASFDHPENGFGHPEGDNVHINLKGDPKEIEDGDLRIASPLESDTGHSEAENGPWRSAPPLIGDVHLHHNVGFQDQEGGGWRSADYGSPGVEHIHHNGEAKFAENGGWRSAGYPVDDHVHPIHNDHPVDEHVRPSHNDGAKSAENGGWRSADYPVGDHVHPIPNDHPVNEHVHPSHHDGAKSAENGGWRSASDPVGDHVHPIHIDHPVDERVHPIHNGGAKSAENEGRRTASDPVGDHVNPIHIDYPVDERVHPSHNGGAKSAENGGWRSASDPVGDHVHPIHNDHSVDERVHPSHNDGAKSAENGGWRSASYPVGDHVHPIHNDHLVDEHVHLIHNGGAKSAENGGWRIVNDGFPGGEGDLTQDEGMREAQGEMHVGQPNGSMKNIQDDASKDLVENGSLENRIEES